MFVVCTQLKSCLFLFGFTAIVFDSQALDKSDYTFFNDSRKNTLKDEIESYLQALEDFDTSKGRLVTLVSAIKNLSQTLDFYKQDEFSAPLFVFPSMRRQVFPDLRYRTAFKGFRDTLIGRVDVLIHRWDGMLFAFSQYNRFDSYSCLCIVANIFRKIEIEDKKGRITYRGVQREISHLVLIGLKFRAPDPTNRFTVSASCLCDSFDASHAMNVTV